MPISTTQQRTEAEQRQRSVDRLKLPLRGVISRPLPDLDAVEVALFGEAATSRLKIRHPYMGVNSWIRVMPDRGSSVFTMQRGDDVTPEIIAYKSNQLEDQLQQNRRGETLYRRLDEGEIELMSSGRAYLFLGSGGDIEMRGGVIRQELLQSRLEHRMEAPLYTRKLPGAKPDTLGYQERFGVVKRADQNFPNALENFIKTPSNEFAVEYSRVLTTKEGSPLVELYEGNVYDETGAQRTHTSTNKPLRYNKIISDDSSNTLFMQVDEALNVFIDNNSKAVETTVNLGSKNVLSLTGKDTKFIITKTGTYQYGTSLTETSPQMTFNAATSFTVKSAKAHLKAPITHFGNSPSIPIALATPTATAFSTMIGLMQSFFTIAAADPALPGPTKGAAGVLVAALPNLSAALQNIPSTQVFASG